MNVLMRCCGAWNNLAWRDSALTGFGEQTSDVQIFILGTTDTRLTINDLHMRNSILPAAHADDRPIDDSVSVVPTCPKHMCI